MHAGRYAEGRAVLTPVNEHERHAERTARGLADLQPPFSLFPALGGNVANRDHDGMAPRSERRGHAAHALVDLLVRRVAEREADVVLGARVREEFAAGNDRDAVFSGARGHVIAVRGLWQREPHVVSPMRLHERRRWHLALNGGDHVIAIGSVGRLYQFDMLAEAIGGQEFENNPLRKWT